MKIERENLVRAKFMGWLITILLAPVFLLVILSPEMAIYLLGVLLPFGYLAGICFHTRKREFSGLLPLNQARFIYLSSATIGLLLKYIIATEYGVSWFISAFIFVFYEPKVYNMLVILGLIIPPAGQDFK